MHSQEIELDEIVRVTSMVWTGYNTGNYLSSNYLKLCAGNYTLRRVIITGQIIVALCWK
jgi:hypothetical protein